MELSIKNFKKNFTATFIKNAEKLTVRELEEAPKGNFVCFVDDGAESFDVNIQLTTKDIIKATTCDCGKNVNNYCLHILAALSKIGLQEKEELKERKKNKKELPALQLLKQIEEQPLKDWLKEILTAEKDLQLLFMHHFSENAIIYKAGDATKITQDAIKTVVRANKKNIDISELKKITDIWSKVHEPILHQYFSNAADKNNFYLITEIINGCLNLQISIYSNSNKITKYIEQLKDLICANLANIKDEETFSIASNYFLQYLDEVENPYFYYLKFIQSIFDIADVGKKQILFSKLIKTIESFTPKKRQNIDLSKFILKIISESGNFKEYAFMCAPLIFENTYNLSLINNLIEIKDYKTAEQYCKQITKSNYHEEYNVPYWELLKTIYTNLNDIENANLISDKLLPYNYDLAYFLKKTNSALNSEENKKFADTFLTKVRAQATHGNIKAINFIFELYLKDNKIHKLISLIKNETPYSLILAHFETIYKAEKEIFLYSLMVLYPHNYFLPSEKFESRKENETLEDSLLNKILAFYTKQEILITQQNINRKGYSDYSLGEQLVKMLK